MAWGQQMLIERMLRSLQERLSVVAKVRQGAYLRAGISMAKAISPLRENDIRRKEKRAQAGEARFG